MKKEFEDKEDLKNWCLHHYCNTCDYNSDGNCVAKEYMKADKKETES